jgi:transposase-like protein
MSKQKRFTPEQKYQVVKEFITGKGTVTISQLCEKHAIHASQFYQWQELFFQGALERFKNPPHKKKTQAAERKVEQLEDALKKKEHIISEIMAENLELKKSLSE